MAVVVDIRQEIENSLCLYLPSGLSLSDAGTLEYEFERVSSVNYQVPLLLCQEVDSEYFLDFVEAQEVDMDNFLESVCNNLEQICS